MYKTRPLRRVFYWATQSGACAKKAKVDGAKWHRLPNPTPPIAQSGLKIRRFEPTRGVGCSVMKWRDEHSLVGQVFMCRT